LKRILPNKEPHVRRKPVYSAYRATSSVLVAEIARLHFPEHAIIADLTFGKGHWWHKIPTGKYQVIGRDIVDGHNATASSFDSESIDVVCIDPPFMRSAMSAYKGVGRFRTNYKISAAAILASHDDVLRFYDQAAMEAQRILKKGGLLLIKCQDAVIDGTPRLTHVELLNRIPIHGLRFRDLFVQVLVAPPMIPRRNANQRFARKSHSYFILFERPRRQRKPKVVNW
jgi:hypothetical protein